MPTLGRELFSLRELLGVSLPPVLEAEEAEAGRDEGLVDFLRSIGAALAPSKGKTYETGEPGARLKVVSMLRPMEDSTVEEFDFVLPLTVIFEGAAEPEIWAKAEKAMEAEFVAAIQTLVAEFMEDGGTARLVRRTKSDPYKANPKSLTMLRFRVE